MSLKIKDYVLVKNVNGNPFYVNEKQPSDLGTGYTKHLQHAKVFETISDVMTYYKAACDFSKTWLKEHYVVAKELAECSRPSYTTLNFSRQGEIKGILTVDGSGQIQIESDNNKSHGMELPTAVLMNEPRLYSQFTEIKNSGYECLVVRVVNGGIHNLPVAPTDITLTKPKWSSGYAWLQ